jgi:hypothetical protein
MSNAAVNSPVYVFSRANGNVSLGGNFDDSPWDRAATGHISNFHSRGSDHRPQVRFKGLYDDKGIYVRFDVRDRYVVAKHLQYQDMVCHDSCVEFFVRPREDRGYFNFEINCGGTMLLYYIEDATPNPRPFAKWRQVTPEDAKSVRIEHSLPKQVVPELTEPTHWQLGLFVPYSLFEAYMGPISHAPGATWRGNFYKCADSSSHPHWAYWAEVGEPLNFHKPERFAPLRFE